MIVAWDRPRTAARAPRHQPPPRMKRDGRLDRGSDPAGDTAAIPDETFTSIVFG